MIRSRTSLGLTMVTALAVVTLTACSAGSPASPVPSDPVSITLASPEATAAAAAITLRLANPDDEDRPSQAFLDLFASEIARASGGSMAVDVIYHAGGDQEQPKGQGQVAAERVMSGDVEMGLVPVRAWSDVGVTSLQALMAPFLIDNDALLTAVTKDPLVKPLLDGMAEQGLVGLTVWPEDLRHPFTFEKNGAPLVRPEDFKGQTLGLIPSTPQAEIIETLGGTVVNGGNMDALIADGIVRGTESGLAAGAYGLAGLPTATGDVTLYPKIQVLVAEDAAWSRLSAEQQAMIKAAATAARDLAIEDHPSDADLARKYCDAGGKVVLAGPAAVAEFMVAAKPIYDRLESDPLTATALAAIRALKASTPPSPVTGACGPKESATATIPPVEPGPPATLIPDGTYRQVLTKADLVAGGAGTTFAGNNAGIWALELKGSQGSWTLQHPSGDTETCPLTQSIEDDLLRLTFATSCYGWIDFRWTLDGDQLSLTSLDHASGLKVELVNDDTIFGGPWTKVE